MATDFFNRKSAHKGVIALFCAFFAAIFGYTIRLIDTTVLVLDKSFYFLVSESAHIEASTHFAAWNGGAGYVWEQDGREYVVLSVYLTEADAQSVQARTENTGVKRTCVDRLYLRKRRDKKNSDYIQGGFRTLYGWLTVTEGEINRLSEGCTQQSCRQTLNGLYRQMCYAAKANTASFPAFAEICVSEADYLEKITQDTIYVKDLRYFLCRLCTQYCRLAEKFAV